MYENEVKLIALFFFFSVLDDKKAIAASSTAADIFYYRMKKKPDLNPQIALVSVTKLVWNRNKKKNLRGYPQYSTESGWLLPEGLDISPWKEFQKSAQEDELLAVIWSKILKINDEDISSALGIPEGTLRYRVGRALRKLGAMTQGQKQNINMVLT